MAYFALLLYTAILFIRPQEWVGFMKGWPILDFVVGFAILAWLGHLLRREWSVKDAPQNWLMLGLFVAVIMSHVRHTYMAATIESFQSFGKVVLIYFLMVSVLTTKKRIKGMIAVIVIGCLFMSLHGILQAHTGLGFGGAKPLIREDMVRVRAMGIFHDPNDLSLMLVSVMPFLVSVFLNRESAVPARALCGAALIPMLYCVYLTNSRGGWLALAVTAGVYAYMRLPYKKLGMALGVLALPAVVVLGPSRVETIGSQDGSIEGRVAAWGYGNYMLKQWPIFGAGKGRFTEFSDDGRVAHNSFVHCYAELGLFGYFFWIGLIMASLWDGYTLSKAEFEDEENQDLSRLGEAGVAGLIGFLAAAFFLSRTYIIPLYLLFALMAALRSVADKEEQKLPERLTRAKTKYVAAAELTSIPAFYVMVRILNLI